MQVGGGRRVRTDDIQLAKLALYQLSYTPDAVRPAYFLAFRMIHDVCAPFRVRNGAICFFHMWWFGSLRTGDSTSEETEPLPYRLSVCE